MKIAIIIFSAFFSSFHQHGNCTNIAMQRVDRASKTIDTFRYAILKFDKKFETFYGFDKDVQPAALSEAELIKIEKLIFKQISKTNSKYQSINDPSKYYKQFVAVINSKGEKEVWVNCFCSADNNPYWKKEIVFVLDGSICYFNLKVNLTKSVTYDLMINGNS